MQWDAEEPSRRRRRRDEKLRTYFARELATSTPFYRRRAQQLGVDAARIRGLAELARLGAVTWDDVAEAPAEFLVQPSERDLSRTGDRRTVVEIALAKVMPGRRDRLNRDLLEPRYKPIVWLLFAGLPVAYTDADLDQLAVAGARVLSLAGLQRHDVLVDLTEAGPDLAHWQVRLGARRALVPTVPLGPRPDPRALAAARPVAVAGSGRALLEALAAVADAGLPLAELRALVVVGEDPDGGVRYALAAAGAELAGEEPAVVAAWAPRGARALWPECPGGDGYHTFPDMEIVEVGRAGAIHADGPGELIWSSLGWRGTVFFRLLTGDRADLVDEPCDACGHRGPLVVTGSREALGALQVLEATESVTGFQLELRRVDGSDELLVYLALRKGTDVDRLLARIDPLLVATQYVVLPKRSLDARVRSVGSRVLDAR